MKQSSCRKPTGLESSYLVCSITSKISTKFVQIMPLVVVSEHFCSTSLTLGVGPVVQDGGLQEEIAQHFIMSKMADHITSCSCYYTTSGNDKTVIHENDYTRSGNDKTVTSRFHQSWIFGFVIVVFPFHTHLLFPIYYEH